jgi:hypothetical protein
MLTESPFARSALSTASQAAVTSSGALNRATTTTAAPSAAVTTYVVKLTVTLSGMTKTAFNSTLNLNFRTQIATKVGVTPDSVALEINEVTLRRLLASGLNISVSITFASQAASNTAQASLNKTAFESIVASTPGLAGVVGVTGVSAPVVATVTTGGNSPAATPPGTTSSKLGAAPPRRQAAAALAPLAALAAAWAACAAAGPLTAAG